MRQYQVPQFITVEDKVIGPFTVKQFLYLAGGGGVILVAYVFLNTFLLLLTAALIGTLSGALAFLKVNEQPFPIVFKNAILYLLRPRLFIWKKQGPKRPSRPEQTLKSGAPIKSVPKLSESKLTDLAWSLDIEKKIRE